MKNNKLLAIVAVLLAATTHASAWSGSGTTDTPWLISSEADWDELAAKVNGGESYYGKYFQLTEDISVTTMVGRPDLYDHTQMGVYGPAFCGTFDGGGHSITVEYEVCESDDPYYVADWAVAPFRVVGHGAVLSNVHTKGKISGCIGFAAGLIGCVKDIAKGTIDVTVEHCRSSVDISVYTLHWGDYARPSDGGIIGSTTGWHPFATSASKVDEAIKMYGKKNIQLRDCVFDGSLSGNDLDTGLGGLVGSTALNVDLWFDGCVFAPYYISLDHMETQSTFVHILREEYANMVHFAHCYYVNDPDLFGGRLDGMNLQGTRVYSIRGKSGVTTDFSGYELIPLYDDFKLVKLYKDASGFKGFRMGNALYAQGTETLSLHLEGSNAGYNASSPATLTGCDNPYTLQMNNANCEITPAPVTITTASSELSDCMNGASKSIAFTNPNNYPVKWVLKRGDEEVHAENYASVASPVDITSYLTEDGTYTFSISSKLFEGCLKEDVSSVSFEVYAAPTAKITSTPAQLSSCLNGEDKAIALSTYADQIKWELKRGSTVLHSEPYADYTAPIEIPATYLTMAGNYTFTISAKTSHGCEKENIDEVSFTLYAGPVASITTVSSDLSSCLTGENKSVALSTYAEQIKWVLKRDGSEVHTEPYATYSAPIEIPSIFLTEAGSYTFTISAKTVNGCETEDISSVSFDLYADPVVEIKTASAKLNSCLDGEDMQIALSTYAEPVKWTLKRDESMIHSEPYATYTAPIVIPASYLTEAGNYTFTISARTANGCEKENISSVSFKLYADPTVSITTTSTALSSCLTGETKSVALSTYDDPVKWVLRRNGWEVHSQDYVTYTAPIVIPATYLTEAGSYTFTISAKTANGCEKEDISSVSFNLYADPTASITTVSSDLSSCLNGENKSIALSAYDDQIKWVLRRGSIVVHIEPYIIYSTPITIPATYLTESGDYTFAISARTANGCEKEDEVAFTIYPIPAVTFDIVPAIKTGTATLAVTLNSLPNATKYDYWVKDALGNTLAVVGEQSGVPATEKTITLNTGSLTEGIYTLYVLPQSETCDGEPATVNIVVNNKPTITFGTEEVIVCSSEEKVELPFTASSDAVKVTYSVAGGVGNSFTLASHPSPLTIDVKGWTPGTYTVSAFASSSVPVDGDTFTKDFTILAPLTVKSVLQPKTLIGCDETYTATIEVNLANAAGRTIYANYTDGGIVYNLPQATDPAAPTALFTLTGLTDHDHTDHTVNIYIDGFAGCAATVYYDEPKLKTITPDFTVTASPKSCDEDEYTLTGTVVANCNEGTIVVEYNESYSTEVPASTTGSTFTITDIPTRGGMNRLKAYFLGKTCSVVESAVFFVPSTPSASIKATMPATVPCDQETFNVDFELSYTYQGEGTLTVWADGFPEKTVTYKSEDGEYYKLDELINYLYGTIEDLPSDGRTGVKLNYKFDAERSCEGAIDLPQFPRTPQITTVDIVNGTLPKIANGTYNPEFKVSYKYADDETLVLEYRKANGEWVWKTAKVSADGTYTFTGLTFDDVAMGTRKVYVYFYGSTCKFEKKYTTPAHAASITTVSSELSSCLTGENKSVALSTYAEQIKWVLKCDGSEVHTEPYATYTAPIEIPATYLTTAGDYTFTISAKSSNGYTIENTDEVSFTLYADPTASITTVSSELSSCLNGENKSIALSTYDDQIKWVLRRDGSVVVAQNYTTYTAPIEIPSFYLTKAGDYTFAISARTTNGCEKEDEVAFTIYPIPAVTIDLVPSVKIGTPTLDVALNSLPNATKYEYWVEDKSGNKLTAVGEGTNPATEKTITLATGSLPEGIYTLYVLPQSETCDGEPATVNIVVNDKPTISFGTEEIVVCSSEAEVEIPFVTTDAVEITYTINDGTSTPAPLTSPLSIDITTLSPGTYTVKARATSSTSVTGDESQKRFTILAQPTASATQPKTFIGCGETYTATIEVNLANAAGRTIYANYTDGGIVYNLPKTTTPTQDPVTFTLTGLTDHDHTDHTVNVYIDGFAGCAATVYYDEPKLKTITPDFTVTASPKSCDEDEYMLSGTVVANCNEGTIVVEYNESYSTEVPASTTGSTFTITDIPTRGGINRLKAYFPGKTCSVVESAVFFVPSTPSASVKATMPTTVPCDQETFNVDFELSYTYQGEGTLTVWADGFPEKTVTYKSEDGDYYKLDELLNYLYGTIEDLPSDGRTGVKLNYKFDAERSCEGAIDLPQFPRTPLITDIVPDNIPNQVSGESGTYNPTFTVSYERTAGETLVLEYLNANGKRMLTTKTVSGDGTYTFTGLTFDDVAMGTRKVYLYFSGSTCKHEKEYTAPQVTPQIAISEPVYSIPAWNSSLTNLTFRLSYTKQQGNLHVAVSGVEQPCSLSEDIMPDYNLTRTVLITVPDLLADAQVHPLHVWFDGNNSSEQTINLPKAPFGAEISDIREPQISDEYCDADDYTVTVTFSVTNGQGKNVTATCKGVTVTQPSVEGANTLVIRGVPRNTQATRNMPRNAQANIIELFFPDATNAVSGPLTVEFTQHPKPELVELTVGAPGEIPCGATTYRLPLSIRCANLGTATLTMWLEDDMGNQLPLDGTIHTDNETSAFVFTNSIDVPADNKPYTLHVKAEGSNWHSGYNSLTAAIPAVASPDAISISLTPIDPLCDSEKQIVLPFAVKQSDIARATLTLTGSTVVNAAMDINATNDTLTYTLTDRLTAGKHTAIVEAGNTAGCFTTVELPIEVAQDSIIFSKWTEVLVVDNHEGIYIGYLWYQNGQPVGNESVLHVPAGMSGNTYYCRLTLRDGSQIYTCEHAFDDIPRSAEHQQEVIDNTTDADRPYKIVENDHVIIIRAGERYDVTGVKR